MNRKKKKKRGKTKVTPQFFFLLLAILALIYASILGGIDIDVPDPDGSVANRNPSLELVVPTNTAATKQPTTIAKKYAKPRLEDYIQGWNITKNVNWLLDFSIVGFPKTGTSTLMLYLKNQTQTIFIFEDERCELGWNQQVRLLTDLHRMYQSKVHMGIKCPCDLEVGLALDNYRSYFPETRFVVGVRSPIRWFESIYNHRIHNEYDMPPPQKLVGRCAKRNRGVCTNRANFSQHLSKIEASRKVFLYDIHQLKNEALMESFLRDLEEFLGLDTPLKGPMIHVTPGRKHWSKEYEEKLMARKIDICDDRFTDLRGLLQKQASKSSDWILDEFLTNPNVKVSSPDYFKSLVQEWHNDPCDK